MQKTELADGMDEKGQAEELKAKALEMQTKAEELQAKAEELQAKAEELQAKAEELQARAEELKAKIEEMKAKIAERVRGDSRELAVLTSEDVIVGLDDDLRCGKMELNAILTQMAAEEVYQDIKSLTTTTGMVFYYSDSFISPDEAAAKSLVEEAKILLARAIRDDSMVKIKLTPVSDLYTMAPDTDPVIIDALLKEMQKEARSADIKMVRAVNGDVYYHSENYLVGSYAATLLLAEAGDHYATIAETVRDESRTYPRTSNIAIFREQHLYGIPPSELETIIAEMLRKPEYGDIKKVAHPTTGAIHLYSERYITEDRAWAMMDWEEVGAANNP